MNLFKINSLVAGYDRLPILKKITVNLNTHEFIGLIGPNGAGKSTFLKVLWHLLLPWKGEIHFKDRLLTDYSNRDLAQQMVYIPQFIENIIPMSVLDFIRTGRFPFQKFLNTYTKQDKEIIDQALQVTDSLNLKDKLLTEISGGELQLVRLARALAQNQEIIIMDEPTSGLDLKHTSQIMNLLRHLNKQGTTIITVLHDINLAAEFCSRIIAFKQGEIFFDGAPPEVIIKKNIETLFKTNFLVDKSPLSGAPYVYPQI